MSARPSLLDTVDRLEEASRALSAAVRLGLSGGQANDLVREIFGIDWRKELEISRAEQAEADEQLELVRAPVEQYRLLIRNGLSPAYAIKKVSDLHEEWIRWLVEEGAEDQR